MGRLTTRGAALALALLTAGVPGLRGQQANPVPGFPTAEASQGPTWENRLLTGLAGAALGAALGFFASQVDRSDWAETPGRSESPRALWSAVGGGVGFALGFAFPLGRRRAEPGGALPPVVAGDRSVLLREQILGVSADNAWDVIRLLRPEWLNARPPTRLGELDEETVPVYLDDFRYGDIDSLRDLQVQNIDLIRFIPPSVATARWGVGHPAGVIQVIQSG